MSRRMRMLWGLGVAALASCSLFSDTGSLSGANEPDGSTTNPPSDGAVDDRASADVVTTDVGAVDAGPPCPKGDALLTDPLNCGACRHDCLGGECRAGKCLPIVLATGQPHPHWLAVDDGSVYWTDGTSIHSCAKSGCDAGAATVVAARSNIFEIAAGDGIVAWTECTWGVDGGDSTGGVYHCATPGCSGAPTTAITGAGCMSGVAIDAPNGLLYASSPYGTTYRCAPGTCSLASAAIVSKDQLQYPSAITIADDGAPYWTVAETGLSGCASPNCIPPGARIIGQSQRNAFLPPSIVGSRGYWSVYWAAAAQWFDPQDIPAVTGSGQVLRASLDGNGGAAEVLVAGGTPTSIVADELAFRFTEHVGGAILECPSSGCDAGPTVLANGQGKPFSLVQDDGALYWGNYGDGRIMKLAK